MEYATFTTLLSLERLAYGVVWKKPHVIRTIATKVGYQQKEPEMIFNFVRFFKLIQMYVMGTWYMSHYGYQLPTIDAVQLCIAAAIILFGQVLNGMVWYRIGKEGVCYGCKFERNIPWCDKFPYSHFNHPQYLGAILTVWGMFAMTWNDYPNEWFYIPLVETILYGMSMKYWEAN